MTGRILIVDTVPTNQIVLKVKMLAAQFTVDACGSRADAEVMIAARRPDLILSNLSDPTADRHGFCKELKEKPETARSQSPRSGLPIPRAPALLHWMPVRMMYCPARSMTHCCWHVSGRFCVCATPVRN
jgi:CheY-like chemotaxis protein